MGRVIKVIETSDVVRFATEEELLAWGATELEIEVLFNLDPNLTSDVERYYTSRINDMIQENADQDYENESELLEFIYREDI
jgi:hypothetical protein